MAKKVFKKSEGTSLVAVIGDEDTVTGFLLAGIGERNTKGETNFLIVGPSLKSLILDTPSKEIEETFRGFLRATNIAVILVNQHIAEKELRHIINEYDGILPTVLEIPSKEFPYEAKKVKVSLTKDTIMQRANKLLYGTDIK